MPLIIRIEAVGLEEGDPIPYLQNVAVMTQAALVSPDLPPQTPIPPSPFLTPTLSLGG